MTATVDASSLTFLSPCRSCGAEPGKACAYRETVAVFCWLRVDDAFGGAASWRSRLVEIRDRYVRVGPFGAGNAVVTKCLLCGAEMPALHDGGFSCGIAAEAIA